MHTVDGLGPVRQVSLSDADRNLLVQIVSLFKQHLGVTRQIAATIRPPQREPEDVALALALRHDLPPQTELVELVNDELERSGSPERIDRFKLTRTKRFAKVQALYRPKSAIRRGIVSNGELTGHDSMSQSEEDEIDRRIDAEIKSRR